MVGQWSDILRLLGKQSMEALVHDESSTEKILNLYWDSYFIQAMQVFESDVNKAKEASRGPRMWEVKKAGIYELTVYGLINGLEVQAKKRMRTTINVALANLDAWDQERLLAKLADDWVVWRSEIMTTILARFGTLKYIGESYYRPHIRPYAVMVFFYEGLMVAEKLILGGAIALMKLGVLRYAHTWAGTALFHGIQYTETVANWIHNLRTLSSRAVVAMQYLLRSGSIFGKGLIGVPPVGLSLLAVPNPVLGLVALAAASLAAGYFLGIVLIKVTTILGIDLPGVTEENREYFSQLPAETVESIRMDANAAGDEVNKIYAELAGLFNEVQTGKVIRAYSPPLERLASMESRLMGIHMKHGEEYLAIVREPLLNEIHELGDTIRTQSGGTLAAAEFPINVEEVKWMIDWAEVWKIIEQQVNLHVDNVSDPEDKMEEIIALAIEDHREDLEEYGARLVEKAIAKEQEINSMTADEAVAKAIFNAGEAAVELMEKQEEDPFAFTNYVNVMKSGAERLQGGELAEVNGLILQIEAYVETMTNAQEP